MKTRAEKILLLVVVMQIASTIFSLWFYGQYQRDTKVDNRLVFLNDSLRREEFLVLDRDNKWIKSQVAQRDTALSAARIEEILLRQEVKATQRMAATANELRIKEMHDYNKRAQAYENLTQEASSRLTFSMDSIYRQQLKLARYLSDSARTSRIARAVIGVVGQTWEVEKYMSTHKVRLHADSLQVESKIRDAVVIQDVKVVQQERKKIFGKKTVPGYIEFKVRHTNPEIVDSLMHFKIPIPPRE